MNELERQRLNADEQRERPRHTEIESGGERSERNAHKQTIQEEKHGHLTRTESLSRRFKLKQKSFS